jgi:AcrR family transcriptional regulator
MKPPDLSEAFFFQVFDMRPGKSEKRKIKIIEATIDSIAKVGFDGTTFDAIGKLVGMQRTHVNYYFSSRDELIKTAVRYAVALGQQITIGHVQKAKGWREQLKAVIEGPFEWMQRYPKHAPVMSVFYHLCSYDKDYRALQSLIRSGGEARLLACFDTHVERKLMTKKRALEQARAIQAMMTGNLIYSFTSDIPLTMAQLKAATVKSSLELVETQGH